MYRRLTESGRAVVAPSLLAADFSRLGEEIRDVEEAGADVLHLDVMDGHFVPNITFGPFVVEAISRLASLPLFTHLMIDDPGSWIDRFVEAGSALVSFHLEAPGAGEPAVLADRIRAAGALAGLSVNPDTPLSRFDSLLDRFDLLMVMGVFPGFGGQRFMPAVLDKIRGADGIRRRNGLELLIEVDGGVKAENAGSIREAGTDILVAGTAVFGASDYAAAIRAIRG